MEQSVCCHLWQFATASGPFVFFFFPTPVGTGSSYFFFLSLSSFLPPPGPWPSVCLCPILIQSLSHHCWKCPNSSLSEAEMFTHLLGKLNHVLFCFHSVICSFPRQTIVWGGKKSRPGQKMSFFLSFSPGWFPSLLKLFHGLLILTFPYSKHRTSPLLNTSFVTQKRHSSFLKFWICFGSIRNDLEDILVLLSCTGCSWFKRSFIHGWPLWPNTSYIFFFPDFCSTGLLKLFSFVSNH